MLFGEIYMLNSKGSYSKGTKVFWKWGRGKIKDTVLPEIVEI